VSPVYPRTHITVKPHLCECGLEANECVCERLVKYQQCKVREENGKQVEKKA